MNEDDYEAKVMEEFDISGDSYITENEFIKGVSKWLNKAQQSAHNQGHSQLLQGWLKRWGSSLERKLATQFDLKILQI